MYVLNITMKYRNRVLLWKLASGTVCSMYEYSKLGRLPPMAPRCLYSTSDVLVIEDLAPFGFKIFDRREGFCMKRCMVVMRTLARFHAASAVLHQQEPESMEAFQNSVFSEPLTQARLGDYFTGMTNLLADEVTKWAEFSDELVKKLRIMAPRMVQLAALASKRDEGRFNVLTHDDLWINNIMFRGYDDVRLIDFQVSHFTSPGNDLQFFVCTSAADEVRKGHITTLLQEYHSTLCESLIAMDYDGKILTFKEVEDEYNRSSLYGFIMAAVFLPATLCRPGCAVPSFDSECSQMDGNIYDGSKFRDVMRAMLPEFQAQGAFELAEKLLSYSCV
ncbi:uncharacterized protein [Periplaneta americana]|uniref:uncharacterized protein isoform X3 n=1 Tax=Periplaneta americana TaxID=6978 RepID=UPI0037E98301